MLIGCVDMMCVCGKGVLLGRVARVCYGRMC